MIINVCVSIYDPTESIARSYQKAGVCGKSDRAGLAKPTVSLHRICPVIHCLGRDRLSSLRRQILLGDFRASIGINRDIATT
jgi:hypothetical protein